MQNTTTTSRLLSWAAITLAGVAPKALADELQEARLPNNNQAQTWVDQAQKESAENQPPPTPTVNSAVEEAQSRLTTLSDRLKEMGVLRGPAQISPNPLMIDGLPAIMLIVGDYHSGEVEKLNIDLLERLRQEFQITTLFREGQTLAPGVIERNQAETEHFDRLVGESTLSPEQSTAYGFKVPAPSDKDYRRVDYSKGEFANVVGIESNNPETVWKQDLVGFHRAGIMRLIDEVAQLGPEELFIIKVEDKYTSTWLARLKHSDVELSKKLGAAFPTLPPIFSAVQMKFPDGQERTIIVASPDNKAALMEYAAKEEQVHRQVTFVERNPEIAQNVARALKENGKGALSAGVIGLGHLFAHPELSPPSFPDELARQGISTLTVFPKSFDLGFNPAGLVVIKPK